MRDWNHATVCPYCSKDCDMAAATDGDRGPSDGDISLCIGCGHVSIFDGKAPGRLRKTTAKEAARLATSASLARARTAWLMMDQMRRARESSNAPPQSGSAPQH